MIFLLLIRPPIFFVRVLEGGVKTLTVLTDSLHFTTTKKKGSDDEEYLLATSS